MEAKTWVYINNKDLSVKSYGSIRAIFKHKIIVHNGKEVNEYMLRKLLRNGSYQNEDVLIIESFIIRSKKK